jgi:hypothetical protein
MNASPLEVARIKSSHTCLDKASLSWEEKVAYLAYCANEAGGVGRLPLAHLFEDDIYIRELYIPACSFFFGREHRIGHVCELVSGRVLHMTEAARKEVVAPFRLKTTPGYLMVFYAITDIIGRTYHPNPDRITDVAVLEKQIFSPSFELFEKGRRVKEKAEGLGYSLGNLIGYAI